MIKKEIVDNLIEERLKLSLNDIKKDFFWEKLTQIFSEDEKETINFLNQCRPEQLYWIKEVFEDISEKLQSKNFIDCIEKLNNKYKSLNMNYDIEFAKKSLRNTN